MRYILIILVLLSVGVKAQMVIKAHANYRPYAQPAANLLLDDYPNAAAAYSLRKLDKDYTGAAIRVRKDTTGQPEQDIGFTANGDLDTAALKSFLNARSGRVVRWYDQSGNGRDKINSTAATQPEIAFLGVIKRTNGKPCVNFQASHVLTSASTYTITHHVMVARVVVQSVINYSYTNANTGFFWNGTFSGVNGLGGFDGTNVRSSTGEDLNQHLGWFSQRSGNLFVGRDGVSETNTGTFAASITIDRLGGRQNATGIDFNGEVQEVVAWNSDQSSNRTGIENNINDYYNIYWNGDFTGILDTYPNSAAAYSLRNLSSTYTGPLIRVRKDTTGQPEMDIYGDYYGNLDTVGLKNFLLTRSGFVTTWYDQSGQGRDATQATQANQPRIALTGVIERTGGEPAIFLDGSNDRLTATRAITDDDFSCFGVASGNSQINQGLFTQHAGAIGRLSMFNVNSDKLGLFFNNGTSYTITSTTIAFDGTQKLLYSEMNGSGTSHVRVNNSNAEGTLNNQTLTPSNTILQIGSQGATSPTNYFTGRVQEFIIYQPNQSSNRAAIRDNINTYYGIY